MHTLVQLLIICFDFGLAVLDGIFELHGGQLVEDVAHGLPDHVPGDLVLGLGGGFNGVPGQVIESDNVPEHSYGLVEGAVPEIEFLSLKAIQVDKPFRLYFSQIQMTTL